MDRRVRTYGVKNIKNEQSHGNTLKYRLTDTGQQCFACALVVPCSPLGQKNVHQQFFIKMTNAAFKNLFTRESSSVALARLSHRNSVCPSVCPSVTRVDQTKTV